METVDGRQPIHPLMKVLSNVNVNPNINAGYPIINVAHIINVAYHYYYNSQVIQIQMAEEEQKKKKKGPPFQTLPNKQVIPLLGFGTYKLQDEKVITQMLRKGLQQGYCRHIDTARYYNNQIPLGKAIQTVINQNRTKREELFIATKIFNHVDTDVQAQIKQALSLMQLKYFDAVYLHWPFVDPTFPVVNHQSLQVFWAKMESLVHKGYTKHLAVSNFNGQLLVELLTICKIKPVLLQIEVHPYLQNIPLVELAQKNGIVVIAHTPLMRADGLDRNDLNILKDEVIGEIAAKYGRKESQIILKSTLYRNVGVIPKTSCAAHLIENCESWMVELVQEDMKKIRLLNRNYRVCDAKKLLTQLTNWE